MKRMLSILSLLALFPAFAGASQTINCKFTEASNPDRVLITLSNDQIGALLYSTGPQDEITTSADGKLALKRSGTSSPDDANFVTQVEVMQMTFKMPKVQVLKSGVSFKAILNTNIQSLSTSQDQELSCSAI